MRNNLLGLTLVTTVKRVIIENTSSENIKRLCAVVKLTSNHFTMMIIVQDFVLRMKV